MSIGRIVLVDAVALARAGLQSNDSVTAGAAAVAVASAIHDRAKSNREIEGLRVRMNAFVVRSEVSRHNVWLVVHGSFYMAVGSGDLFLFALIKDMTVSSSKVSSLSR